MTTLTLLHQKPNGYNIPSFCEIPDLSFNDSSAPQSDLLVRSRCEVIRNLFTPEECDHIITTFRNQNKLSSVSVQGRLDIPDDRTGSMRCTGWNIAFADAIFDRIKHHLTELNCDDYTATDWHQNSKWKRWKPVGVSPLHRFMIYREGGQHYSHYDAAFIYPDPKFRTLKSIVLYLSTSNIGATRFIDDKQDHIRIQERDLQDWTREVEPAEIIERVCPIKGSMLMFNHRECHDVEQYHGSEDRIIIRGDIIYEGVD